VLVERSDIATNFKLTILKYLMVDRMSPPIEGVWAIPFFGVDKRYASTVARRLSIAIESRTSWPRALVWGSKRQLQWLAWALQEASREPMSQRRR
jgi:hypothetical protein